MSGTLLRYFVIVFCGYFLGQLNMAVAISEAFWGGDVRKKGSGNAGATNMTRVYGWGAGALTLGGDMMKAIIACLVGYYIMGDWGITAGGIAVMCGHCFPAVMGFKGGKGIAVGAALGLMIDWRVFVAIIVVFLIVALVTKKVSAGSIAAAVAITVASVIFQVGTPKIVLAAVGMCIAIFCHRTNIKRLSKGEEPDFVAGKAVSAVKSKMHRSGK